MGYFLNLELPSFEAFVYVLCNTNSAVPEPKGQWDREGPGLVEFMIQYAAWHEYTQTTWGDGTRGSPKKENTTRAEVGWGIQTHQNGLEGQKLEAVFPLSDSDWKTLENLS